MEPVLGSRSLVDQAMQNAVIAARKCVLGIQANAEHARDGAGSLGIVTLNRSSATSSAPRSPEGYLENKSIHQIVVEERKLLTQQKWDEVFSFENMINPQYIR